MSKKLANIYWTPKLYKNLIKAKFATTELMWSVKPLSNAVTAAFNQM